MDGPRAGANPDEPRARLVGPPAADQNRCAVLGFPIEHSLSPVLHNAAYAALGLTDWHYERFAVDRGELAEFLSSRGDRWRGFSMTMPLKDEALELGDVTPEAALTGAANTLIVDGDRIVIHNTDIEGFWRPLQGFLAGAGDLMRSRHQVAKAADPGLPAAGARTPGPRSIASAVVLGGGATARSAFYALTVLGVREITVSARTRSKVEAWAPIFDATGVTPQIVDFGVLPESDLLISTVTTGAADPVAQAAACTQGIIFDAIYDPWPSELARAGLAHGRTVFSGLDMLVGQALAQVELMTGRPAPMDVMMSAGRAALRTRGSL